MGASWARETWSPLNPAAVRQTPWNGNTAREESGKGESKQEAEGNRTANLAFLLEYVFRKIGSAQCRLQWEQTSPAAVVDGGGRTYMFDGLFAVAWGELLGRQGCAPWPARLSGQGRAHTRSTMMSPRYGGACVLLHEMKSRFRPGSFFSSLCFVGP